MTRLLFKGHLAVTGKSSLCEKGTTNFLITQLSTHLAIKIQNVTHITYVKSRKNYYCGILLEQNIVEESQARTANSEAALFLY